MECRDRCRFLQICRSSFRQPIRAIPIFLGKRDSCRGNHSVSCTTFENQNIITFGPLRIDGLQACKMASIFRPTMLRQRCLAAASKRTFSTKLTSSFPAINKPAASLLTRQVVRSAFAKDALPGSIRVAAFHASGRRAILPALPRKPELQSQMMS